ncbi:MAG: rhomboid family intramembrane serine protease [Candidatus Hydrogenedentes bacterium]|nr:rhomboid family intramembrane serine protease [Candidatus Hydrogenedentota bacterium]
MASAMLCPVCSVHLKRQTYLGVDIDICEQCKGVWFDRDEMSEFLDAYIATNESVPNAPVRINQPGGCPTTVQQAARFCPRCGVNMRVVNYAYDSNIFVDRCEECGGTWVDGDEVVQLASFCKGNPKLDKLGVSMAKHVKNVRETAEMIDGIRDVIHPNSMLSTWLFFVMPFWLIPIGDSTERKSVPWCTLGLILANVAVMFYVFCFVTDMDAFWAQYGSIPALIWKGNDLYRFITSMFIHAGIFHILGNMLFLGVFGDNVEAGFGHIKFILFYLVCGICSDLVFAAMHPAMTDPVIGASGAIAGVIGAYFVLYPEAKVKTFVYGRVVTVPAVLYLGLWFLMQLVYLHIHTTYEAALGVAFAAHVGGFVTGLVLAIAVKIIGPKRALAT